MWDRLPACRDFASDSQAGCLCHGSFQQAVSACTRSINMRILLAVLLWVIGSAAATLPAAEPMRKLYVANSAGNDLHVIDTATNQVIKRVEVGPEPHGLAASASGDR